MEPFILSQTDLHVKEMLATVANLASTGDMATMGFAYGVSPTSGDTTIKQATITNYVVKDGSFIAIMFTNAFLAEDNYLTVNGTGYGPILLNGEPIMPGRVKTNTILTMYRGAGNWHVVGVFHRQIPTPGAVDLGLPSGTLWAESNVGASSPTADGKYFSWGNVTGYLRTVHDFTSDEYDASAGAAMSGNIAVGNDYDMARANMGAPWRLPTVADVAELAQYCDQTWIPADSGNTQAGLRLSSRLNGNTLFMPAGGYIDESESIGYGTDVMLWTGGYTDANFATAIFGDSSYHISGSSQYRYFGMPVRAVQ